MSSFLGKRDWMPDPSWHLLKFVKSFMSKGFWILILNCFIFTRLFNYLFVEFEGKNDSFHSMLCTPNYCLFLTQRKYSGILGFIFMSFMSLSHYSCGTGTMWKTRFNGALNSHFLHRVYWDQEFKLLHDFEPNTENRDHILCKFCIHEM